MSLQSGYVDLGTDGQIVNMCEEWEWQWACMPAQRLRRAAKLWNTAGRSAPDSLLHQALATSIQLVAAHTTLTPAWQPWAGQLGCIWPPPWQRSASPST